MKHRDCFLIKFCAALLPLTVLFSVMNTPMLSASEPSAAEQFRRSVHSFKKVVLNGRGNWLSPPSPWIPYINRQNRLGLSPAQHAQYLSFQEKGKCGELAKLEEVGFLSLYPELSQAFLDTTVKKTFFKEIIPLRSFGVRRCQALALVNPIIEREKKLDAEYYYLTIPGTNLGNKLGKVYDPREIVVRKAFKALFDLAACHDYKPAIKDIIKYRKLFLIFVGNDEVYYFSSRAIYHGIDISGFDPVVIGQKQTGLSPRLKMAKEYLARGDLVSARKLVFKYSYISCGKSENE